ncbi:MAG: ABC transporter permease subunit [Chloroflexota bacterium]
MTATGIAPASGARFAGSSGPLSGFGPLFRKDVAEWMSGKRAWVIAIVSSLLFVLTAANSYINSLVIAAFPDEAAGATKAISLSPTDNILTAVGTQIFVIVAIFAAMSLLVTERERGTLAWVASKPVSRMGIWTAKWASATAMLWIVGAVIPMVVTFVTVVVLYGAPPIMGVVLLTLGMGAAIALYVAVTLTASTFVASQPAVAAVAFAVFIAPTIILAILPGLEPYLPTSIETWFAGLGFGEAVGFITPIIWLVGLAALAFISSRRIAQLEL